MKKILKMGLALALTLSVAMPLGAGAAHAHDFELTGYHSTFTSLYKHHLHDCSKCHSIHGCNIYRRWVVYEEKCTICGKTEQRRSIVGTYHEATSSCD